jgi:CRISPR/Cas system-associated exonuclease Cas4 (RecB family)
MAMKSDQSEKNAMRSFGLSKSKISAFEQCSKRLWLQVHRRELAEFSIGAQARFAAGNEVGDLACSLHPEGVMVEAEPDLRAALKKTSSLIAEDHPGPIFEATFEHQGLLVRVDILEREDEGWAAAEVKSSTRVKDYHRGDLATQVWAMEGAGIKLKRAAIRHIDNSFILRQQGEFNGLFQDSELLSGLTDIVSERDRVVAEARKVLGGKEPQRETGDHCSSPFECEFHSYCSRGMEPGPEWPVTILPNGGGKKWLEKGVMDLLELDESALSPVHARILAATRDDVPFHDTDGARKAMGKWAYPRAWLDFETISPAVPRWIGTRPYQQVPFQFSLHFEEADGTITHHEFLSCDGSDPRRACAEALVKAIPADATLVAYNASFEKRVLHELAEHCPDLAEALLAMKAKTVDLLPVARKHWYHRDQRGSWSIKAVLPTVASLDYGSLEVKDGADAQKAWLEAADLETTPARRRALEDAMKEYCERDTKAMILVARALAGGE